MRHAGVAVSWPDSSDTVNRRTPPRGKQYGLLAVFVLFVATSHSAGAAPKDLDTGFGTNGTIGATRAGFARETTKAVARQSDGKLVIAGDCYEDGGDRTPARFCVRRLLASGGIDSGFGGDGTGVIRIGFFSPNSGESATAVAVQSDGKIVVGGACNSDATGANVRGRFCVTRLLPNGGVDSASFGVLGQWSAQLMPNSGGSGSDSDESLSTLLLQPDGKIVVVGRCTVISATADQNFICHHRLGTNGQVDSGYVPVVIPDQSSASKPAVLQTDGKIVLGGQCRNPVSMLLQGCVTRLTASGALDSQTFGNNGQSDHVEALGIEFFTNTLAIQGGGELVLVGSCSTTSGNRIFRFCVRRWRANGSVDAAFSAASSAVPGTTTQAFPTSMAVQGDGKIIVAGTCVPSNLTITICLSRFNADGSRDAVFGPDTVPISISSGNDLAPQTVAQPDGTILLAATCGIFSVDPPSRNVCAARLIGGPTEFSSCSGDVNGDGEINATDSLILARVAHGFNGSAVMQGIPFASHATRKTWPQIRDYLSNHCAMRTPL